MTSSVPSSTATTPRSSVELAKEGLKIETVSLASSQNIGLPRKSAKSSIWTTVKRHLKEHHDSVNAVYANTYGWAGGVRARSSATIEEREAKTQEVWRYERGVYGRS
ncbi:hypothetical protein E8E11_001863 [Didymella keratinophila]|nr:hypothetical protein E8E11_001863 [Didymella keratinophila]